MLHLFLVDTALERIPAEFVQHKSVTQNLEKFGNAARLLDTTLHHSFMHDLPRSEARGRPDILHHFLLQALGSPANLAGKLKIYFHSPDGLYSVRADMRCPRDIHRFKSLMVQLLELGHIPAEKPYLIERIAPTLQPWIMEHFEPSRIWKMSRSGTQTQFPTLCHEKAWHTNDVAVLIGGFQKGSFSPQISALPGNLISLTTESLDSWVVVTRILSAFEYGLN
jgi:rRNA small subunit pseudouridine methyltransferase Nep1